MAPIPLPNSRPTYHGEPSYARRSTFTPSEPPRTPTHEVFLFLLSLACLASICASVFGYGIGFLGAAAGFWGAFFILGLFDEDLVSSFILGLLPISVLYLLSNLFAHGAYFDENFLQPFLLSFILSLISPGLFHLIKKNRNAIRNYSSQFLSFFTELFSILFKKLWGIFIQVLLQSKKEPISRNPRKSSFAKSPSAEQYHASYYAQKKSNHTPELKVPRRILPVSRPEIVKGSSQPINFENMTVKQLKEILDERGNIKSGNKLILIKRLREDNLLPEERSWIK